MSPAGAPARAASASAPGWLELSGTPDGPRLAVALDRRATCRVEAEASGYLVEAKETLTRTSAASLSELVERAPASFAARVLAELGAPSGLRIVTEWKLPVDAGIRGEAALALATTAAVAGALGREPAPRELAALAARLAERTGHCDPHGLEAALVGGVVLIRPGTAGPVAEPLPLDPGRIDEALMVVDAGEAAPHAPERSEPQTLRIAEALVAGRHVEVVDLLAEESATAAASVPQRRVMELVRQAGGAARPLGRLVAVWAPPGERGPGRREAVRAALEDAGLKPLTLRVDLRGLERD